MKAHALVYDNFITSELVDNQFEGTLAIDDHGIIFFCNGFFLNLLERHENQVIGKNINTLLPKCQLLETLKHPYAIWGETLKINHRELIIKRYPLIYHDQPVGAVLKTLFTDMNIAREVSAKITQHHTPAVCSNLHTCMDIIGESEKMLLVKKLARKASRSISNLLVTGESGTGKTIMVEAIHSRSIRRDAPFVKVNCAAIPENLLESELFGYDEGAFTGAKKRGKPGKFERANGGTLFLDEIGDMPLYMQSKLLQAIQDKRIERIGGNTPIDLDVRIIAATNRDLTQMIRDKQFREDLYYRLKVLEINMPSLRDIPEDIPHYVDGLIQKLNLKLGLDVKGFTKKSMVTIKNYQWPGNVRQLENFLEQAMNYSDDAVIDASKLFINPWSTDAKVCLNEQVKLPEKDFNKVIDATEKELIINAINTCKGNKTKAADLLNMHRSVLYKKIKRLEISL